MRKKLSNSFQTGKNHILKREATPKLRNHGITDLRNYGKLALLCYAKTTANGRGDSRLIAQSSQLTATPSAKHQAKPKQQPLVVSWTSSLVV